jgi:hypothetical protein
VFRNKVDAVLDGMIASVSRSAAAIDHLATAKQVDAELFKRHTIETILRIRLARIADGKAISLLARSNPRAAQKWAGYAEEEMLHDKLFLKDLKSLGVAEESVYRTEPLLSTRLLQGYLYYTLEHEGPRGLVSKAYFLEYTTLKTQGLWNQNVKQSLGERAVRGANAHLAIDQNDGHSSDVWNVLMELTQTPEDEERVLGHMRMYCGLFTAYFHELAGRFQGEPLVRPSHPAVVAVTSAAPQVPDGARA